MSLDKIKESGIIENLDNPTTDDWIGNIDTDLLENKISEYEVSKGEKRKLKGFQSHPEQHYDMDFLGTMQEIEKKMDAQSLEYHKKQMQSGENPKIKLIPRDAVFFKTGEYASGNFLTEDHPGETAAERKENLQLPPKNDAESVSKVVSRRAQIGIESDIAPQPEWAEQAGYTARQGMKQIYTPNTNPDGAISDGRYENEKEKSTE